MSAEQNLPIKMNNNENNENEQNNENNTKKRTYNFKSDLNRKKRSECLRDVRRKHLLNTKIATYELQLKMINSNETQNTLETLIAIIEDKEKTINKLFEINRDLLVQLNKK